MKHLTDMFKLILWITNTSQFFQIKIYSGEIISLCLNFFLKVTPVPLPLTTARNVASNHHLPAQIHLWIFTVPSVGAFDCWVWLSE